MTNFQYKSWQSFMPKVQVEIIKKKSIKFSNKFEHFHKLPVFFFSFYSLVFAFLRLDGFCEFRKHVFVNNWIKISAQHINNPPITDVNFVWNGNGNFPWHHAVSGVENTGTNWWHKDDEKTIDDESDQHDQKNDVPEPDEDVSLFVDDVQGKNAKKESLVLLKVVLDKIWKSYQRLQWKIDVQIPKNIDEFKKKKKNKNLARNLKTVFKTLFKVEPFMKTTVLTASVLTCRAFESNPMHHIYGRYIWSHVETRKPSDPHDYLEACLSS